MFWGDEDEDRARHSLSDALSDLRRVLGRDAISGRSAIVQLESRDKLAVDAIEMEAAFNAGDFARVRELYEGTFLANSPSKARRPSSAGSRRCARSTKRCTPAHWMPQQHPPKKHNQSQKQHLADDSSPYSSAPPRPPRPSASQSPSCPYDARATGRSAPTIALTDVFTDPADTSLSSLSEGLKQMIAADLGRVSSASVVAPAIVREAALDAPRHDSLSSDESTAIARRVHAGWAASASVLRRRGSYVVHITLRDVEHAAATRTFAVGGDNILVVADQAAARMLSALDAHAAGPRLSDVETGNTDAYRHFIRSEEMRAEGNTIDQLSELDAAIAADSGFTSAIVARVMLADAASYNRLRPLFDRTRARMTPWDVMSYEAFVAASCAGSVSRLAGLSAWSARPQQCGRRRLSFACAPPLVKRPRQLHLCRSQPYSHRRRWTWTFGSASRTLSAGRIPSTVSSVAAACHASSSPARPASAGRSS